MRVGSILLAGALSTASLPAPAKLVPADIETPTLVTRVDCTIVIDKTGRIADYRAHTELPEALGGRVRDMVRAVRFEPVVEDAHVVNAQTEMRVTITATRLDDGGLRLALDNLSFPNANALTGEGRPNVVHKATPLYPREALRAQAQVELVAAVRFDSDGNAADVVVEQSALMHAKARPKDAAAMLDLFEKSAVETLGQWTIDPSTMSQAMRDAGGYVAHIPARWWVSTDGQNMKDAKPGEWTMETRTRHRTPAWLQVSDNTPQPGAADLADGQAGEINRRYRLAEPLAAAGT
jgi:hypothetical protein